LAATKVAFAPQYGEFGGFGAFTARGYHREATKINRIVVKFPMQANRELL
jgi:hypothetical protein